MSGRNKVVDMPSPVLLSWSSSPWQRPARSQSNSPSFNKSTKNVNIKITRNILYQLNTSSANHASDNTYEGKRRSPQAENVELARGGSELALVQRFVKLMDGLKANKTDWTRYDGESGVQAVLLARDLGLRVDKYLDSLAQAVELVSDDIYDAMADSMDVIRDHILFIATTTARLVTGWKDGKGGRQEMDGMVVSMLERAKDLYRRLEGLARVLGRPLPNPTLKTSLRRLLQVRASEAN